MSWMPYGWIAIGMLAASACWGPNRADGEPCDDDFDCASEVCRGNICVESQCSCGSVDCGPAGSPSSSCQPGFVCVYHEGDQIFGGDAENLCHLSCANGCPAGWRCLGGLNYCAYYGPDVTISYTPKSPRAHELVRFEATIDPPVEATFQWSFDFGSFLAEGPVVERAFSAGRSSVSVTAEFRGGTAGDLLGFDVCANPGEACTGDVVCCGGLACAADDVCR